MKKFAYSLFGGLLSLLFLLPQLSHATHAMGTDLTYRHVSGETYEFTLIFYRDCAGTSAPGSVLLNINSPSGCGTTTSVTLTQVGPGVEVSPLCPTQIGNSTCNSGTLPGVQQFAYTGTFTFPTKCNDWNISWNHCCRNNMITNLASASSFDMYVETTLDNSGTLNNTSPTFTSLPVPYICAGQPFCYNHGAVDADGDSLVYSLVNPLDGPFPATNIGYNAGFTPTYPISTISGSVSFDPNTGSMCVTPNAAQVAVVTILVEEYRNGTMIGSTMRDLQVVVQSCSNVQPDMVSGGMTNLVGGVALDSNSVEVCPGDPVSYDIVFQDVNAADIITLSTNLASSIPGASVSTSGSNPATLSFSWTPTAGDVGFNSYTITVQDDGCPILGSQVFSFDIRVLAGTYAGPDLNYCPAGGPVTMSVSGGTSFTWNVLSGDTGSLTCNPCANQTVTPNTTTTYEVVSNLSSTCRNRDTVVVNRVPDFPLSLAPANPGICLNEIVALNASAGPSGGPFTYSWSPGTGLDTTTLGTVNASPQTTTEYFATVTSAAGCTILDSVTVTVTGIGPTVIPNPTDTAVCAGSPVQLDALAVVQPGFCGLNPGGCTGTTSNGTIGTATTSTGYIGPFYSSTTSPYLMRHQYLYTAAELQAAGFAQGGTITAVGLDLFYARTLDFTDFTIKMGCTSDTSFVDGNYIPGLSTVYFRNTHSLPNTAGMHMITLDTPYDWDGTSSIIVEYCSQGTPDLNYNYVLYSSTSPSYRTIYDYGTTIAGCNETLGIRTTSRPNMQFEMCSQSLSSPVFAWSPATGLSNPNILNPVANPATTTTYQLNVTDGSSGCTGSSQVTVTVGPAFSLNGSPDSTLCYGASLGLQANPSISGTYSYNWTPSNGLSSTSSANPTATPTSATDYVVEVSNGGCTRFDTVSISLAGTPVFASADQDTVCPGTAVQLNVTTSSLFADDFEPMEDMTMWSSVQGATANANCGTNGGSNALHFDGTSIAREAVSTALNTSSCTALDFCIIFGSGAAPCEAADAGEDVELSYSLDGGTTWVPIALYDESLYTTWTCISEPLPVAAQAPNVMFRWQQVSFSVCTGCDNWALDDVSLSCAPSGGPFTYSWSPSAGLSNSTIQNPVATVDAINNAYSVVVTDLSNPSCPTSSTLSVTIDSTVFVAGTAADHTPCGGDNVQLNSSITGSPLPASLPSCGINGTALTQPAITSDVGTGTSSSSTYSPFYGTYEDCKYQFLVTAAELTAAGIPSGTITEIGWNILAKTSTSAYRNLTISLTCTGSTSLSTVTGWEAETNVYGPQNYSTVNGWNTFSITPFDWDGTSNIAVTVCYNNGNNSDPGGLDYVAYSIPGFISTMRNYSATNGTNGCNLAPLYTYSYRPNLRFTVVPPTPNAFTYSWSPPTGLNDPTLANPTATFSNDIVYTVTVNGGNCSVSDTVELISCGVLPADALELTGEQQGKMVELDWWTWNEQDADFFVVERSADGAVFEEIGRVDATGTYQGELEYGFVDERPLAGANHYRLRLVNQDGSADRSNSVMVFFDAQNGLLKLYPNPVGRQEQLNLEYYSEIAGELQVTFFDLRGRLLGTQEYALVAGVNLLQMQTAHLAGGSYFLQISDGKNPQTIKLVVLD